MNVWNGGSNDEKQVAGDRGVVSHVPSISEVNASGCAVTHKVGREAWQDQLSPSGIVRTMSPRRRVVVIQLKSGWIPAAAPVAISQ